MTTNSILNEFRENCKTLYSYLSRVEDPRRIKKNIVYPLPDLLVQLIAANLSNNVSLRQSRGYIENNFSN
jgi:hypothetical protein